MNTRRISPWVACIAAVAATLTASAVHAEPLLTYPARGVVDIDEGSFATWLKIGYDPQEETDTYLARGAIVHVSTGDPLHGTLLDLVLQTQAGRDGGRRHNIVRLQLLGRERPAWVPLGDAGLQRDDWIHVTVTWTREAWAVFVDGQKVVHGPRENVSDVHLTNNATIYVGSRPRIFMVDERRHLAMQDVHFSAVAWRESMLDLERTGEPSLHSLLLLSFEPNTSTDAAGGVVVPLAAATGDARGVRPLPHWARLIPGRAGHGHAMTLRPDAFASSRSADDCFR